MTRLTPIEMSPAEFKFATLAPLPVKEYCRSRYPMQSDDYVRRRINCHRPPPMFLLQAAEP